MARVIQNQRNPWGSQAGLGGEEPQRNDLWVVDLSSVVRGVATQLNLNIPAIPSYFAQSVTFPELRVRADQFRRDSRPYNMPSFDDPPDPVRITFILDAAEGGESSRIYSLLNKWRSLVRAGRGAMSTETDVRLNQNYRIDFAFNINVRLLKGSRPSIRSTILNQDQLRNAIAGAALGFAAQARGNPNVFSLQPNVTSTTQQQTPQSYDEAVEQNNQAAQRQAVAQANTALLLRNAIDSLDVINDLQYSGAYTFKNAWLGGFKLSDLTYVGSQISTIEAQFYIEDVFDENGNKLQQ